MPDQALQPFGPRVLVIDPPQEEQKSGSGLIVPSGYATIHRGIVVHGPTGVVQAVLEDPPTSGDVVYYHPQKAIVIEDKKLVAMEDILAIERTHA